MPTTSWFALHLAKKTQTPHDSCRPGTDWTASVRNGLKLIVLAKLSYETCLIRHELFLQFSQIIDIIPNACCITTLDDVQFSFSDFEQTIRKICPNNAARVGQCVNAAHAGEAQNRQAQEQFFGRMQQCMSM